MNKVQFHWHENDGLHIALYAGKEMMISESDDGSYQLTYLDMLHPETFVTVDQAKKRAPDLAIAVLEHMMNLITERAR